MLIPLSVHYTSRDLVCAHSLGYLFILRNYREVLQLADAAERDSRMKTNTVVIAFLEKISCLAIDGDRVVIAGVSPRNAFRRKTTDDQRTLCTGSVCQTLTLMRRKTPWTFELKQTSTEV